MQWNSSAVSQCRRRSPSACLAATPLALVACAVDAQTSVTLYGVLDSNVEYVTNMSTVTPSAANGLALGPGKDLARMTSGGLSGSRWGLRGAEDLGSGLKALFVLESGFGVDDGRSQQGGRLFGRQAYVGLDHAVAGKLTFGRQYTSLFDVLANFSPTGFGLQYEPLILGTGVNYRSDNVAKYTGQFGGLTAVTHWTFGNGVSGSGEVPGQFRRDSGYGAGLAYSSGAFGVTAAYDQYNPTVSVAGETGMVRKAAAAASYAVGNAKVMAGYRWGRSTGQNDATVLRDDYYWFGVNYQATPALALTVGYYYDDAKNVSGVNTPNPWQVLFIADYSFSRRTDVYLTTAYTRNAALNMDSAAIGYANGYYLGKDKNHMFGVAVGVRHKLVLSAPGDRQGIGGARPLR